MPHAVVASTNPVKIAAVAQGLEKMFPDVRWSVAGISVSSGVSDQPMTDHETLQGALNRALAAQNTESTADLWVGIEGGCADETSEMTAFAWVVALDSSGQVGRAKTGTFLLPSPIAELIRQGVELGEADDRVFGRQNSKQSNGAVGLLTNDVIDRTTYYREAVVLALIPFKNPELFTS